mgnify:CR=1 FL=1
MAKSPLTASELSRRVEEKAYAYGVSKMVATLLGEYIIELIKSQKYDRHKKRQLVQNTH